jgi:nicotinamidase-related amidase
MLLAPVPIFPLTERNAALLLIDPQHFMTSRDRGLAQLARERGIAREFEEYYAQVDAALRNMARLLTACRKHRLGVAYTLLNCEKPDRSELSRQLRSSCLPIPVGSPLDEIRPEVAPAPGDWILPRGTFSPFVGTNLLPLLHDAGVDTIILAGILANISLEMTAREAADRGFGVVLVWDAAASETLDWHTVTMTGIVGGFVRVRSTPQVIEMLEGTRT